MPKINQEEYEVLKGLDDRWKWIARNYNGALITYMDKPMKNPNLYWDSFGERMDDRLFQFIQWEDEEPHNVAELIEEYESEETEVKNIEWVKQEIKKERNRLNDTRYEREVDDLTTGVLLGLKKALNIFNQLDEPEVLSSDWIKDNQLIWTSIHGAEYYVPANKLYGKIVPKQEITGEQAWEIIHGKYGDEVLQNNIDYVESQGYVVIEKPTVPQFVADWYKQNKYYVLSAKFKRIADWEDERVVNWYEKCTGRHGNNLANVQETIALMDLVGYEVEEEQKYYVINNDNRMMLVRMKDGKTITVADPFKLEDILEVEKKSHRLTEQEIKDYDERYWAFAVKVEELEE